MHITKIQHRKIKVKVSSEEQTSEITWEQLKERCNKALLELNPDHTGDPVNYIFEDRLPKVVEYIILNAVAYERHQNIDLGFFIAIHKHFQSGEWIP